MLLLLISVVWSMFHSVTGHQWCGLQWTLACAAVIGGVIAWVGARRVGKV